MDLKTEQQYVLVKVGKVAHKRVLALLRVLRYPLYYLNSENNTTLLIVETNAQDEQGYLNFIKELKHTAKSVGIRLEAINVVLRVSSLQYLDFEHMMN